VDRDVKRDIYNEVSRQEGRQGVREGCMVRFSMASCVGSIRDGKEGSGDERTKDK
jgi:hypothetical protein